MTNERPISRVAIEGELSIFTAMQLHQQLLNALDAGTDTEVDLSRVSEMDSAGIQLMVAAQREATARNQSLRFTGHNATVNEILALCNLSALLGDSALINDGAEKEGMS